MARSPWIEWSCPHCGHSMVESDDRIECGSCDAAWPVEDGIRRFMKGDAAWLGESDCAETLQPLFDDENNGHWLYWSRMRTVLEILQPVLEPRVRPKILDVGCGTGYVLERLRREGALTAGVEVFPDALRLARERDRESELICAPSDRLPLRSDQFDVLLSLDVYEHLKNEFPPVEESFRVLAPGGRHLVFVPAHRQLWSRTDRIQGHHRRYGRKELEELLSRAGFTIERSGYIMPMFVLPALLVRKLNDAMLSDERGLQASLREFSMPPAIVNKAIRGFLSLERAITLRTGAPFGVTAYALGVKA
jgi:SAM-dependent methyltransferase